MGNFGPGACLTPRISSINIVTEAKGHAKRMAASCDRSPAQGDLGHLHGHCSVAREKRRRLRASGPFPCADTPLRGGVVSPSALHSLTACRFLSVQAPSSRLVSCPTAALPAAERAEGQRGVIRCLWRAVPGACFVSLHHLGNSHRVRVGLRCRG